MNNEVGFMQPVGELGKQLKSHAPNLKYVVDAVCGVGKCSISTWDLVDAFTVSGHKFCSLGGLGASAF